MKKAIKIFKSGKLEFFPIHDENFNVFGGSLEEYLITIDGESLFELLSQKIDIQQLQDSQVSLSIQIISKK